MSWHTFLVVAIPAALVLAYASFPAFLEAARRRGRK